MDQQPEADLNAGDHLAAPLSSAPLPAAIPGMPAVPPGRLPRPGFLLALVATVAIVVGQGIAGAAAAIAMIVAANVATGKPLDDQLLAVLLVPVGVLFTLLVALLASLLIYGRDARRALALRGMAWSHLLLIVAAMLPYLVLAEQMADWATELLPSFTGEVYRQFADLPIWLVLLFGGLGPAVSEEIIFRGILGRGLVARYGAVGGAALTALCFGIVHVDLAQAASILCLGWLLQGAYLTTRSLAAPMLIHLLNNCAAFTQLAVYDPFAEIDNLPWRLVVAAAVALVALCVVIYEHRARWILPDGGVWSPGYPTAEMPPSSAKARCRCQPPRRAALVVAAIAYAVFWAVALSGL